MAARCTRTGPSSRHETCCVLARDQPALVDLVYYVLHPLRQARGGAGPLVETLAAYFDSGCVASMAAARLHFSVRAVTYRLDRVKTLTGFDRWTRHTATPCKPPSCAPSCSTGPSATSPDSATSS